MAIIFRALNVITQAAIVFLPSLKTVLLLKNNLNLNSSSPIALLLRQEKRRRNLDHFGEQGNIRKRTPVALESMWQQQPSVKFLNSSRLTPSHASSILNHTTTPIMQGSQTQHSFTVTPSSHTHLHQNGDLLDPIVA